MSDNSSNDKCSDIAGVDLLDLLTPEVTEYIQTLTDLWSLAKIAKDIKGDSIWDALYQLGCSPRPLENTGYSFDYSGYRFLYVPLSHDYGEARFSVPDLASTNQLTMERLREYVNLANSLVTENKFIIFGDEIWLIHERIFSRKDDYLLIVRCILNNLKADAEIFYGLL